MAMTAIACGDLRLAAFLTPRPWKSASDFWVWVTTLARPSKREGFSHRLAIVHSMELSIDDPREDDELATLAQRARGGNAAAFEELARRVHARVRRWARRL